MCDLAGDVRGSGARLDLLAACYPQGSRRGKGMSTLAHTKLAPPLPPLICARF